MRPRHGPDQDGVWRIGPVRLLAVVGVGYLIVVLALAALTAGVNSGSSADAGPGPGGGVGTSAPESSTAAGPDEGAAGESAPVSPAGKDVRVGSVENRSTPPRPSPSPSTVRPSVAPPPAAPVAPPVVTSYEAESPANGLAGTRTFTCSGCSGGKKVGYIGRDMGALQFNGVTARTGGTASVTLTYVNGEGPRVGHISVNGGSPIVLTFPDTGGWSTVGTMTVTMTLRPGTNSLRIFNPHEPAPDFDKITVSVR